KHDYDCQLSASERVGLLWMSGELGQSARLTDDSETTHTRRYNLHPALPNALRKAETEDTSFGTPNIRGSLRLGVEVTLPF
ncbi:MAG: hypothetical protein ABI678_00135, partial [Kofleriaceae bacterium]